MAIKSQCVKCKYYTSIDFCSIKVVNLSYDGYNCQERIKRKDSAKVHTQSNLNENSFVSNPEIKMTKETATLILFFIAYSSINVALWFSMENAGSEALIYPILIYPIFWIVSGIILSCMIWLLKIKINHITRIILVLCSTPLPYILFAILATW